MAQSAPNTSQAPLAMRCNSARGCSVIASVAAWAISTIASISEARRFSMANRRAFCTAMATEAATEIRISRSFSVKPGCGLFNTSTTPITRPLTKSGTHRIDSVTKPVIWSKTGL